MVNLISVQLSQAEPVTLAALAGVVQQLGLQQHDEHALQFTHMVD